MSKDKVDDAKEGRLKENVPSIENDESRRLGSEWSVDANVGMDASPGSASSGMEGSIISLTALGL